MGNEMKNCVIPADAGDFLWETFHEAFCLEGNL